MVAKQSLIYFLTWLRLGPDTTLLCRDAWLNFWSSLFREVFEVRFLLLLLFSGSLTCCRDCLNGWDDLLWLCATSISFPWLSQYSFLSKSGCFLYIGCLKGSYLGNFLSGHIFLPLRCLRYTGVLYVLLPCIVAGLSFADDWALYPDKVSACSWSADCLSGAVSQGQWHSHTFLLCLVMFSENLKVCSVVICRSMFATLDSHPECHSHHSCLWTHEPLIMGGALCCQAVLGGLWSLQEVLSDLTQTLSSMHCPDLAQTRWLSSYLELTICKEELVLGQKPSMLTVKFGTVAWMR